jgi:hypothetical protein
MGPMGMDTAADTKNAAGGAFLSCVVDGTIGRGHERVLVPVEVVVSDLDTQVVGLDVLMNRTY